MKKLLHFEEDMFIANMDAGCYIPLILLLPATFLLHTWQTHSGLGKTHPQLCCCVGHLHCLSLWFCPALNVLFKALSLFLFPSVTSYTATVFISKAPLVLPQSHPSSLTWHCGYTITSSQPWSWTPLSITYFPSLQKASLFFLQQ